MQIGNKHPMTHQHPTPPPPTNTLPAPVQTDPWTQFHYYTKMVWGNSHGSRSVSSEIYKDMMMDEPDCFAAIQKCKLHIETCGEAR